ncbi:MAG: hypothetical protein ACR2IE_07290 [Candidatus Sumerlaeaceae bacterium]
MPDLRLRDFIYLDWPRVRSLAVQISPGDSSAEGGVEDLRQELANTGASAPQPEASHQHRVFGLLESELRRQGRVRDFAKEGDGVREQWLSENFADGQVVATSGVFRVLDYDATSEFLAATPDLMKTAYHMANWMAARSSLTQNEKKHLEEQRIDQAKQISDMKALRLDQFSEFVTKVFGGGVRVKIMPDPEAPECLLVGTAQRTFFTDPPSELNERYGFQIEAGWKVLGQVNRLRERRDATLPMTTGNAILDNFESITLHVNTIFRIAHAPDFPAVSFTPLGIYREF